MSLTISAGPASEPVTAAEARTHARVSTTSDDTTFSALIKAARQMVEEETGRCLMAQTLVYKLDGFPPDSGCPIELPRAGGQLKKGITAVSSIAYVDTDGNTQTWGSSNYIVDANSLPARILPAHNLVWPTTRYIIDAVTITFTIGESSAANVEEGLKLAIKQLVDHWYRNRTAVDSVNKTQIPLGTQALMDLYKWELLR